MVATQGGSIPAYCRSNNEYPDAKRFSIIMAKQGEWGVVQACSTNLEQLGFAIGSKHYRDTQHAEITALEGLELQLVAVPLTEREGGILTSACIKRACAECSPALAIFANTYLPGGPQPIDIACGNPEFGIAQLAYVAYLHVFDEHCGQSPLTAP
jgi:hypothetical protein